MAARGAARVAAAGGDGEWRRGREGGDSGEGECLRGRVVTAEGRVEKTSCEGIDLVWLGFGST